MFFFGVVGGMFSLFSLFLMEVDETLRFSAMFDVELILVQRTLRHSILGQWNGIGISNANARRCKKEGLLSESVLL